MKTLDQPRSRTNGQSTAGYTKGLVAEMSMTDIHRLSNDKLVALILAAEVPLFRKDVNDHLPYYDRTTLEQLAFLARRTVRNQGY